MKNKLLVIAIGLFSLILTGVAVSYAQQEGASVDRSAAARGRHCVAQAYQIPEGMDEADLTAEAPAADTAAPAATCFRSFAEALQAATGATSGIAPNITPADVTDELLTSLTTSAVPTDAASAAGPAAPAATRVIGIHYTGSSYTGSTHTWVVGNSLGCTTGYSYTYPNLGGTWLNDVISSYRAYGGCAATYHFQHAYFLGPVLRCNWCSTFDALDNRVSSIKWYRTPPHY